MQPTETLDPRGPWALPRRTEIYRYAQELGIADIDESMPKDLMVKRLQALGIQPPKVPPRPIGKNMDARSGDTDINSHHYDGPVIKPAETTQVVEINADDLLEAQWKQQQAAPSFNVMRAELKAAGVKLSRRWRMAEIKAEWEKLKHGQQNPA